MRKHPATPVNRQSQTFRDSAEIMGSSTAPPDASALANIDVNPADNGGVSVTHRVKSKPGKEDYSDSSRKTNVFSTPHEAHAHIGKLLGVTSPHAASSTGKGGIQ